MPYFTQKEIKRYVIVYMKFITVHQNRRMELEVSTRKQVRLF